MYVCMFQQGSKSYLNSSNWRNQHLNYKNSTYSYRDNDNPTQKATKFPCFVKKLNILKTRNSTSQTTGLRKVNKIYSASSDKERITNEAGSNTGIDFYRIRQRMTSTMSVMANIVRNVVSKQRIRYKENGFNLDLGYICDNIIAMGYPADNFEKYYRNRLQDVYKFLEENHHDHYKVYNLCLERSYDIKRFHSRVAVYPFEDHNPPTIELILSFCRDVDAWLKADELNVVAVHCKAGKGRTGTMICCFLVYSGVCASAEDALACYDEKRTKDRKGVTIPSQKRYVKYFASLLQSGLEYERRTYRFMEIRFSKANSLVNQGTAQCIISKFDGSLTQLSNIPIDFRRKTNIDVAAEGLLITGDIKVEIKNNAKKIFHFWFNTYFINDFSIIEGEEKNIRYVYTLTKPEIDDAHKDKSYPDDFKLDLVFTIDENNTDSANSSRPTSDYRISPQSPSTSRHAKSLPQDSSVGSGLSSIYDLKSASTSGSSGMGVSRPDSEKTLDTVQKNSGINNKLHVTTEATNANETTSSNKHLTQPPNNIDQLKQTSQTNNDAVIDIYGSVGCTNVVGGFEELSNDSDNIPSTSQPSNNFNYNSKDNRASFRSVSTTNEEDWESAESDT